MKKWLKKLLGIDGLERRITVLEKRIEAWRQLIEVGTDVHCKAHSWAVVCIRGKQEYVRFCIMPDESLRFLRDFLRQFPEDNVIMDMIPGMPRSLFF